MTSSRLRDELRKDEPIGGSALLLNDDCLPSFKRIGESVAQLVNFSTM